MTGPSAAADRRDDIDPGAWFDGGIQLGSLAVDEDVNVPPERRAGLAEAVAEAGPALFKAIDRLADGRRLKLQPARQAREQRRQRRWEADLRHGQATTMATSSELSWSTVSLSPYWGGNRARPHQPGVRDLHVTGRSVGWVAVRGPSRRRASVSVNASVVATVDLYSTTVHAQRIVWSANWSTSATRTVTIRVSGTAGHPRVDLDGWVVGSERRPAAP